MTPELDAKNAAKINELDPSIQWAGNAWLTECRRLNLRFKITEAYRTPERQKELYALGRTKPGQIVTYTLNSNHIRRLAVDVLPLNCTHFDIAQVAAQFGITHPLAFDPPHYEFDKVARKSLEPMEPKIRLSKDAEMKSFSRGIARIGDPKVRERAVSRFVKQYGMMPQT